MNRIRRRLSQRLRDLGVEERAWPGRDDGFVSLLFRGKEFAHFHSDQEIDIRLGKNVIQQERLVRVSDSTVHPTRSDGFPWYALAVRSESDLDEALRLIKIALSGLNKRK
jgi:Luciferase